MFSSNFMIALDLEIDVTKTESQVKVLSHTSTLHLLRAKCADAIHVND